MSKTTSRLPVSTVNAVLVAVFLVGAVVTAVLGNWLGTTLLGVLGIFGLIGALYARRADSRDITRVNAIEYSDERDRTIAQKGFAVVGAVALALSVLQVVLATIFAEVVVQTGVSGLSVETQIPLLPYIQLFILALTWGVANSVAARRT